MTRLKIDLVTLTDIRTFIDALSTIDGDAILENSDGTYRINAKSFLGAVAAVEDWGDIWLVSDSPNVYNVIKDFVI